MTPGQDPPHYSKTDVPWRPGSWEPGRYGLYDSIGLTIILTITALVRGFDYLGPSSEDSAALTVVEAAFPLPVWGLAFAAPAVVLAFAIGLRVHVGVWLGHWLLGIAYVALALGLGVEYMSRPWADGIRTAAGLSLPAAIHIMVAVRTGWRPPRWNRAASPK